MKNLIRTGLFVFSIFVIQTTVAYATDYNYLPNDVFLVQQAEKSALEYRLRALENQYQSNPQISVLSIDQRISELQKQRDSEKEYLKGTLAHNGAFSPETWASYSAKIDAKYDPQINLLNQQKQTYQSQASDQQQKDQEIADLKRLILEMQNSIDKQADLERQKVLDNLALEQQKLREEDKAKIATEQQKITDEYTAKILPKEDFSKVDVNKMFLYLDALAPTDASNLWQRIYKNNPEVALKINLLYYKKYPNEKNGDLENVTSPKPSVTPTTAPSLKSSPKVEKKVVTVSTSNTTATSVQATSEIKQDAPTDSTTQQATEVKPEKKSFIQKTSDFFKKIIFWR